MIIQSADSFCSLVWNKPYDHICEVIDKNDYHEFDIPKRNGTRKITSLPNSSYLFKLQKDLLRKFLDHQVTPVCVKGFKKGENYKSYLIDHVGSQSFLRIDIESFFPSVSKKYIEVTISQLIKCKSDAERKKLWI